MFSTTCVKFLGQNYTLFTSSVDHSRPEAKQLTGRGVCVCVCECVWTNLQLFIREILLSGSLPMEK